MIRGELPEGTIRSFNSLSWAAALALSIPMIFTSFTIVNYTMNQTIWIMGAETSPCSARIPTRWTVILSLK